MSLKVDVKKVLSQIEELGKKGEDPATGLRSKLALTQEDKAGRDLVVSYMKELDLDVYVDRVGNIFGVYNPEGKGKIPAPGTAIMIGSHTDSVINAGKYDGCYGVLGALSIIRTYKEAGVVPARPLVAGIFTNEEGVRFQPDMLGSLSYADQSTIDEHLNAISIDGKKFADELKAIGYDGKYEPGFIMPKMFLELHVEQGPVLEAEGFQIGAVTGVQGISWHKVTIGGVANHGGTTPTKMRVDGGMAAFQVGTELRRLSLESGSTLTTVGFITAEPGLVNVIPSKVTFTIDMRDPDDEKLKAGEKFLEDTLKKVSEKEGTTYEREQLVRFAPVKFDEKLICNVEAAAERLGYSCRRIVSGAGHDAQMLARICPTSMIFVPSIKGISHNPAELTSDEDLANGLNVLLEVVKDNM